MAIRTLIIMLNDIQQGGDPASLRPDAITGVRQEVGGVQTGPAGRGFFEEVPIINIFETSGGTIVTPNGTAALAGQATDEPFSAGTLVYASQMSNGEWLIHGSVK